jgi:hypothetical protein
LVLEISSLYLLPLKMNKRDVETYRSRLLMANFLIK